MNAVALNIEAMERRAIQAAIDIARADTRPSVPHERVRVEMLAHMERLRRKIEDQSQNNPLPPSGRGLWESHQRLRPRAPQWRDENIDPDATHAQLAALTRT
jgi:hypothetical protein